MRKYLILAAAFTLGVGVAAVNVPSQAQPYGPGMMYGYGGGYGPGYGMGYGMMGGYGPGYGGYGPGMMYGYGGGYGPGYGPRGQTYRGQRLCWHQTGADQNTGYYGACSK
jgi:hypothetical protein